MGYDESTGRLRAGRRRYITRSKRTAMRRRGIIKNSTIIILAVLAIVSIVGFIIF